MIGELDRAIVARWLRFQLRNDARVYHPCFGTEELGIQSFLEERVPKHVRKAFLKDELEIARTAQMVVDAIGRNSGDSLEQTGVKAPSDHRCAGEQGSTLVVERCCPLENCGAHRKWELTTRLVGVLRLDEVP